MFFAHFLMTEANESNVYLAACAVTRQAVVVDAGDWPPALADTVRRHDLAVRWICITHDHYDHTEALDRFCAEFPEAAVVRGTGAASALAETPPASPHRPAAPHGPRTPELRLADGATLAVGTLTLHALALPGHTADSTVYRLTRATGAAAGRPAVECLFSGDVLFAGSIGGCPSPAQQVREVQGIRQRILTLPGDTPVYPGHGPATTVGIETRANPFLNSAGREE